jgi:hypothetical protein
VNPQLSQVYGNGFSCPTPDSLLYLQTYDNCNNIIRVGGADIAMKLFSPFETQLNTLVATPVDLFTGEYILNLNTGIKGLSFLEILVNNEVIGNLIPIECSHGKKQYHVEAHLFQVNLAHMVVLEQEFAEPMDRVSVLRDILEKAVKLVIFLVNNKTE